MGQGSSQAQAAPNSHVWESETPVSFSAPFVESLRSNSEDDSARAKTLELHIQQRVAAELKKLQERSAKEYEAASQAPAIESKTTSEQQAGAQLRDLSRESVQKEIETLRRKLEGRKQVVPIDEGVEKAKSAVIKCLREHDRRPLDCWAEVEAFKSEVRRLEGSWVEKMVR